jgi:hypothetical protein
MESSGHIDTPPKHEDEVCNFDDDLIIFDLSYSDEENDDKSSDLNDCCHHIKKMSINIQMLSIFITSLIITN